MAVSEPPGPAAARRWRRAPDVLWRATPAGAVLLSRHGTEPQELNPTAAAVWDLLVEPTTVDAAARELADAFGADLAEVRADVDAVVARLAATGLAVTAPPAGPAGPVRHGDG